MGVALAKAQIAEAMNDVRLLLDLSQQPSPEPLGALLEAARRAWDAGEAEAACVLLQQAVPLAENRGYLYQSLFFLRASLPKSTPLIGQKDEPQSFSRTISIAFFSAILCPWIHIPPFILPV